MTSEERAEQIWTEMMCLHDGNGFLLKNLSIVPLRAGIQAAVREAYLDAAKVARDEIARLIKERDETYADGLTILAKITVDKIQTAESIAAAIEERAG